VASARIRVASWVHESPWSSQLQYNPAAIVPFAQAPVSVLDQHHWRSNASKIMDLYLMPAICQYIKFGIFIKQELIYLVSSWKMKKLKIEKKIYKL